MSYRDQNKIYIYSKNSSVHTDMIGLQGFFRTVHMGGQNGILEFCWGARFEIIETLPVHVMKF